MARLKSSVEQVRDNSVAPSGVDPSQWSANPYANYDYRHSWWQKLIEGVGLRSKWDAYRENMAMNSAEYQAQLAEKAHNEEYDSPLEQNARLRAAGINPDLAGETSSGSSSPMEPDPNAPIASEADNPMATIGTFTDMVMSAFTSSIGLANSILGMVGNVEDIQAKANSNRESIINSAIAYGLRQVPHIFPVSGSSEYSSDDHNDWFLGGIDNIVDRAEDYVLDQGFRSKDKRLFVKTLRDWLRSAPGSAEAYNAWYNEGAARIAQNMQYGSSLFSESDATLRAVLDPIIKATDRVRNLKPVVEGEQLDESAAQAAYESAYYNTADGEQAGQVFNKTNERNIHSANIDSILNECMDEIISNLRDKSESGKRGHNFATAALLIFSLLRMTNFNVGASSGPKGSSANIGLGF